MPQCRTAAPSRLYTDIAQWLTSWVQMEADISLGSSGRSHQVMVAPW